MLDVCSKHAKLRASTALFESAVPSGLDNRNLIDDGRSQKLTRDEIESFKTDGTSAETIIQTLVEHSTTFKAKTEYAQQKYLKKKQQKYLQYVTIEQPTARLLAEMYYAQSPLKLGNMRIDALAQLLTSCNVISGGRYIVFDSWLGLVTAAVLERLGKQGSIIQVYPGQGPQSSYRQAVQALNLEDDHVHSILYELPFTRAFALSQGSPCDVMTSALSPDQSETPLESGQPMEFTETDADPEAADKSNSGSLSRDTKDTKDKLRVERRLRRLEEQEKAIQLLKTKSLDGLLVTSGNNPTQVTLTLLEFVAPSRPFAVFCTYQEPLVECYSTLKAKGNALFLKLSETWLRTYQVLPNRTHPAINMSGGGGYLLTGIKVSMQ
ncbi:tRNA (adenine(58)-N(1))-methyltransferase non-catalytic subunit TRM6-like isoform X2 [Ornithodoros turicata]|uniref:tRNA (adenine(58)-N(1))-methyltransferase non-catalytic subunit TRM6-like isoform X2 n=1 Tax=Ornithodoros turicata TaxID=34597 RepID=UPI003138A654